VIEPFPRSFLFVPANRPKLVDSAFRSGAEAIVFDLEDSVVPDQKGAAREAVRTALDEGRAGLPLFVRINAPDTREGELDVRAFAGTKIAGLVIPKVESPAAVRQAVADAAGTPLILLLETPRGIAHAPALAEAAGRALLALAFGAEDFRATMRVDTLDASDPLLAFALSTIAVSAAAVEARAIDAPEMDFADHDRLRARAAVARRAGFAAKFAIHPAQLPVIHEMFGPTSEQRTWAERVTRAYEEGASKGLGSVRVDDRVVDAATVRRARQILERSQA
jgi:citrate lyase subunit beta/citryl-CoA lyase